MSIAVSNLNPPLKFQEWGVTVFSGAPCEHYTKFRGSKIGETGSPREGAERLPSHPQKCWRWI